MADVKKIAVLKASALGDFIVTLPALQAIRRRWPAAEIVLLGRQWHQQYLLKGRTPVDRVIPIPVTEGIYGEPGKNENRAEQVQFLDAMRREQFDIVFNFQGNGTYTNAFIRKMGARLTVGPMIADAEEPDRWLPYHYYQPEMVRYAELAALTGTDMYIAEPAIRMMESDVAEWQPVAQEIDIRPYVVFHPMARDIRRTWPVHNYIEIGNRLKEQGMGIVISGSAEDEEPVQEIVAGMKHPVVNACGRVGLGGLTAMLAGAALVIAPDTGPLHLARALAVPTVGMYWAPNYIKWGPLTRTLHVPLISWNLHCPFCGIIPNDPYPFEPRTGCQHAISFVRDIAPGEVFGQALRLLSAHARGNPEILLPTAG